MGWTYKYPDAEDVDDAINGNIQAYVNDFEDALYSGKDVDEYIDLASFAKWILVHDILTLMMPPAQTCICTNTIMMRVILWQQN